MLTAIVTANGIVTGKSSNQAIASINQLYKLSQAEAIKYLDSHAHKYLAFARRVRGIDMRLAACASLYASAFKQWSRRIASMSRFEYAAFANDWRNQQTSRAMAIAKQAKRNAKRAAAKRNRNRNRVIVTAK